MCFVGGNERNAYIDFLKLPLLIFVLESDVWIGKPINK